MATADLPTTIAEAAQKLPTDKVEFLKSLGASFMQEASAEDRPSLAIFWRAFASEMDDELHRRRRSHDLLDAPPGGGPPRGHILGEGDGAA